MTKSSTDAPTGAPTTAIAEARAQYDAAVVKMLAAGRALLAIAPEFVRAEKAANALAPAEVEAVFAPLRAAGKMDEAMAAEEAVYRAVGFFDAGSAIAWLRDVIDCFTDDAGPGDVEGALSDFPPRIVAALARLGAEDLVTEEEVVAVGEAHKGDPIGGLANGTWHPSTPAGVTWALSLLAQEIERRPAER